jgi:hypothetical protein
MAILIGESWLKMLVLALGKVCELQGKYPSDIALLSAAKQLNYLIALADGSEEDDSALEDITLGYIRAYQIADIISPDVAELLSEINGRVGQYLRQTGRRLKI